MILIGVTQRVSEENRFHERRDSLDQRWLVFLESCGLTPLPLPNNQSMVSALLKELPFRGFLLTGGGNLVTYAGDSPERDAVEKMVYETALANNQPLIGVCRGMQFIQNYHGIKLNPVSGHVCEKQEIICLGRKRHTNSYQTLGTTQTQSPIKTWAHASDGVIKAIRHENKKIFGMMWHPERQSMPDKADVEFFQSTFGTEQAQ